MTRSISVFTILLLLMAGYILAQTGLKKERANFLEDQFLEYTLPSAFLKPLSLEFKGLMSDILLIKFMNYIGAKTEQLDQFDDQDWRSIQHTLDTITDLDPYFWDAYLFSQVFLTWDGKHYGAANEMLEKAQKFFPDDYRIPYYIGLNYYHFAKDFENGAKYLMEASKLPGSPYYLATLAARLSAYGSDHQRGIVFLNEMLKQTKDPDIAEQYKLRIQALQAMLFLEKAAMGFFAKFHRRPANLHELVETGFTKEIPKDPYGGMFYIKENGKVDTTSKLVKKKKNL